MIALAASVVYTEGRPDDEGGGAAVSLLCPGPDVLRACEKLGRRGLFTRVRARASKQGF